MRTVLFNLFTLCVALVLVANVSAADEAKKKKKPGKGKSPVAALFNAPKNATEEQKTAVAGLKEKFSAKAEEAYKAFSTTVPAAKMKEVQKAVKEAVDAAKKDGKKGKALAAVRNEAFKANLNEEQQKAYAAWNEVSAEIRKERAKILRKKKAK